MIHAHWGRVGLGVLALAMGALLYPLRFERLRLTLPFVRAQDLGVLARSDPDLQAAVTSFLRMPEAASILTAPEPRILAIIIQGRNGQARFLVQGSGAAGDHHSRFEIGFSLPDRAEGRIEAMQRISGSILARRVQVVDDPNADVGFIASQYRAREGAGVLQIRFARAEPVTCPGHPFQSIHYWMGDSRVSEDLNVTYRDPRLAGERRLDLDLRMGLSVPEVWGYDVAFAGRTRFVMRDKDFLWLHARYVFYRLQVLEPAVEALMAREVGLQVEPREIFRAAPPVRRGAPVCHDDATPSTGSMGWTTPGPAETAWVRSVQATYSIGLPDGSTARVSATLRGPAPGTRWDALR